MPDSDAAEPDPAPTAAPPLFHLIRARRLLVKLRMVASTQLQNAFDVDGVQEAADPKAKRARFLADVRQVFGRRRVRVVRSR